MTAQQQATTVSAERGDRLATSPSIAGQWDVFLSHLAVAEKAAAQEFTLIAEGLSAEGHAEAARRYRALACEEHDHYERVSRVYGEFIPPPASFHDVCDGVLATASTPLVERMAVTHLAHETAALGFLGHMHGHVHEIIDDAGRVKQLRRLCAGLLCEEVKHVRDGKAFVIQLLAGQSAAVKTQVVSAVNLHRCILIRTVRRLFHGDRVRPFVDSMITNFNRRYRAAVADIL